MTILMLLLLNFPLTSDETACLWELKSLMKISNIQMIYLIVSLLICAGCCIHKIHITQYQ
jgi:hypothetical protein